MAGFQFFHVEAYARTPGKGKAGGHSVRSIIAEASREPNASPHVAAPSQPTILLGDLADTERAATEWAINSKDALGRNIRIDGHCMLGGVISCPPQLSESGWTAYKNETMKWLKKKFGTRLRCAVEHHDEAHRHYHFYAVALPGERFEVVHEGKAAALAEKAAGRSKGDQNRAYIAAMRALQDELYLSISQRFGMSRLGPRRRRLTRREWQAEQKQAEMLGKVQQLAETAKEALRAARIPGPWMEAHRHGGDIKPRPGNL